MQKYDKKTGKETRAERKAKKRRRSLIIGAVLAAMLVIGVLVLIYFSMETPKKLSLSQCETYAEILEKCPELTEKTAVLKVDTKTVSEDEWEFYFMQAARNYAQSEGKELSQYKGTNALPDSVRAEAIKAVVINSAAVSRAKAWNIALTEEDFARIDAEFAQLQEIYGEDVCKMLGVKDEQTYKEFFAASLLEEKVIDAVTQNPEKYLPEVKLNDYARDCSATVKVIEFIKGEDENVLGIAEAEAEKIKKQLDGGERFEDLWAEVQGSEMWAAYEASVYKSGKDMPKAVKEAALSLKTGKVSGIIETDGGYHILMRIVGGTEVKNYFLDTVEVAINKGITDKSKIR